MDRGRMLAGSVAVRLSYGGTGEVTIGVQIQIFYAGACGPIRKYKEIVMLKYAIIFAVVALVAGALGFGGVAAGAAGIAKVLFGLFLLLTVVFLVLAALGVGAVKKALD
jgi:uncharacterized membrane protein YtjA (UPF0391 family)